MSLRDFELLSQKVAKRRPKAKRLKGQRPSQSRAATSKPPAMKLLFTFLLFPAILSAQVTLAGAWEGVITIGGIHSSQELPMELYLIVKGNYIEGRSYVHTPDGKLVQFDLIGTYYSDHSMSLQEIKFVGDETNGYLPKFSRQYQLVWKADIWDAEVKGYWQEITGETFNHYRRRGRIRLTKKKDPGA